MRYIVIPDALAEACMSLPGNECGGVIRALCNYAFRGEEVPLDTEEQRLIYLSAKGFIKRDEKKKAKSGKKRKPISTKHRYMIFERDNFTCQYCGAKAPNVQLEVDHIIPVSKGGSNNFDNLITACWECNRGKCDHIVGEDREW